MEFHDRRTGKIRRPLEESDPDDDWELQDMTSRVDASLAPHVQAGEHMQREHPEEYACAVKGLTPPAPWGEIHDRAHAAPLGRRPTHVHGPEAAEEEVRSWRDVLHPPRP